VVRSELALNRHSPREHPASGANALVPPRLAKSPDQHFYGRDATSQPRRPLQRSAKRQLVQRTHTWPPSARPRVGCQLVTSEPSSSPGHATTRAIPAPPRCRAETRLRPQEPGRSDLAARERPPGAGRSRWPLATPSPGPPRQSRAPEPDRPVRRRHQQRHNAVAACETRGGEHRKEFASEVAWEFQHGWRNEGLEAVDAELASIGGGHPTHGRPVLSRVHPDTRHRRARNESPSHEPGSAAWEQRLAAPPPPQRGAGHDLGMDLGF
jgi:hypothetical protein